LPNQPQTTNINQLKGSCPALFFSDTLVANGYCIFSFLLLYFFYIRLCCHWRGEVNIIYKPPDPVMTYNLTMQAKWSRKIQLLLQADAVEIFVFLLLKSKLGAWRVNAAEVP